LSRSFAEAARLPVVGIVTLTKVERIGGIECLRVDATLQGPDSLEIDFSDEEGSLKKSDIAYSFSAQYPVDGVTRCLHCTEIRRWTVLMQFRGQDYMMKQSLQETVERKIVANFGD